MENSDISKKQFLFQKHTLLYFSIFLAPLVTGRAHDKSIFLRYSDAFNIHRHFIYCQLNLSIFLNFQQTVFKQHQNISTVQFKVYNEKQFFVFRCQPRRSDDSPCDHSVPGAGGASLTAFSVHFHCF